MDQNTRESLVQFVHPVGPGKDDDGWMKPNPADVETEQTSSSDSRVLSLEEIAKHSKKVCFVILQITWRGLK